jgi:hypothetical protein
MSRNLNAILPAAHFRIQLGRVLSAGLQTDVDFPCIGHARFPHHAKRDIARGGFFGKGLGDGSGQANPNTQLSSPAVAGHDTWIFVRHLEIDRV